MTDDCVLFKTCGVRWSRKQNKKKSTTGCNACRNKNNFPLPYGIESCESPLREITFSVCTEQTLNNFRANEVIKVSCYYLM